MVVHGSRSHSAAGRAGFTIVELLIGCAILCLLAGLLLPAINSTRESARRIDCTHRLQQIGLALHGHHDARGALPAGWTLEPNGPSAFGWFVQVLPFSESGTLACTIDTSGPLTDSSNAIASQTELSLALCPSDIYEPRFALYREIGRHATSGQRSEIILQWLPSANFLGVFGTQVPDDVPGTTGDGPFLQARAVRFVELERGLSETFLVSERTAAKCPSTWIGFDIRGEDAAARIVGQAWLGPNRDDADESEFSSRHPGCANFLWADGHVAPIVNEVDQATYRRMARRGLDEG
jgi:prepilin-type processing-associated H-X9-DG protein